MKASIIVPTYNKLPRLKLMLESLRFQHAEKSCYEVIIVDDGSKDGTRNYLDTYNFTYDCKVINVPNGGRASARNRGIQESQGDILIFCDDDLLLSPDYVTSHLMEQERNKGAVVHGAIYSLSFLKYFEDPDKGIYYDKTPCVNPHLLKRCVHLETLEEVLAAGIKNGKKKDMMESFVQSIFEQDTVRFKWLSFNGGNISVPKEWVLEAGGFKEEFGTRWGGEDIELGYRIHRLGKPFLYSESAYNYHMTHLRKNVNEDMKDSFVQFYEMYHDERIMEAYQRLLENNMEF